MLLLDYQNVLIESLLKDRFSGGAPANIDQVVSDFDGVTFHISTPESKTKILVSLQIKCFSELVQYGAQAVLEREYGPYIVSPESGYDFSVLVDLENLPEDKESRDDLIRRISLLKRNAMAAPFEQAFDEFAQLQEEASKYTSESAPQGVKEGGEVRAIHYREEEAIYIKASFDRVTVIFSTVFREETDRIFGKVFLQEFVDARRRAIQNAPQVLFRNDPPLELQGIPGVDTSGSADIGYITFAARRADVISHIQTFRDYFHYHIKASKAFIHSRMRKRTADFLQGKWSTNNHFVAYMLIIVQFSEEQDLSQKRKSTRSPKFTPHNINSDKVSTPRPHLYPKNNFAMTSEASRPKYDSLPGIDTAPDVYETPELAEDVSTIQASTAISESDYGDSDPDSSAVNRQRLQTDQARNRFQPSRVDASGVDFSDNIAQRQAYRTYTHQRRRGEILGDDSDDEQESFSRKLMRVKRELQELEDEYEQRKQSGDNTKIEERDAKDVMELISDKVDELYASRRGGVRGAEPMLDRTIQKFNDYEPFAPSSKITAAIAKQPPLPGTQIQKSQLEYVLAQAAEFDQRMIRMEHSLGLNGNTIPEMGEGTTFPVFTTLQRLEQTLGAIGDASTNNLDAASQQIKKLMGEAEDLKEARLEASRAGSSDNSTGLDQEAKVNALYGTLPSIDKLSPVLPLVLERLRTLRLVHTSACQADEVLTELESRQAKQEEEIKNWEKQLELVEEDVKKQEKAMQGNVKVVGNDIKMLEEKLAKLLAEQKE
ncbi:Arp2/3 complex [Stagonosporopsis vannaccii]|nr:Arp2/3 complex [Stagonosporopsis vannaccii]